MLLPSGYSTYDYSKSAATKGWGAGWPTCSAGSQLQTVVLASGTRIPVHNRISRLVAILLTRVEAQGYKAVPGWCWGYACRAISGTRVASNHSWGLAFDLNAPKNPYTSSGTRDIPDWVFALFRAYGFGVGADYTGKKDWMHFEFMGTPSDADAMLALATRNFGADGLANVTGGSSGNSSGGGGAGGVSVAGLSVSQVQSALNNWGYGLSVDNTWGPATLKAVQAFQAAKGLSADGWVGPSTWEALQGGGGPPAFPLSGGQVFGRWNESGGWAKKTRSGDRRWDGDDVRSWVKMLQQRLIMHGVVPGVSNPASGWADGLYETPTTNAVKTFQRARGLSIDGMVGPVTWKSLWS